MGDMGELFRAHREDKKSRRKRNVEINTEKLNDLNIKYTEKNEGQHLILDLNNERVDFWPGTNKCNYKGQYIYNAMQWITNKIRGE